MNKSISILLVDDHAMMREMLDHRLREEPDMAIVGMAGNASEAIDSALQCRPAIILMDIEMPGMLCFDAASLILAQSPETAIVFLSAFFHDRYIEQALEAGAAGYIVKSESLRVVVDAIRTVAAGGAHYSREVQSRVVVESDRPRLARKAHSRGSTLTERELEILRYVVRGMSSKQIGKTTHRSPRTVENTIAKIMTKLDIHTRIELATFSVREGLAEPIARQYPPHRSYLGQTE